MTSPTSSRPDVRADGRAGGDPMTTQPDPTAVEVWADVAALLNYRADMWEAEGDRPCEARECRMLANAYRTYAEGVGIPSMQSLREKRWAAEAALARVAALGDALHASTVGPVHECGTFIREAIAGTLDAEELATFLEARR